MFKRASINNKFSIFLEIEKICVNKKGANYELMTKSKFLFNSNVFFSKKLQNP